MKVLVGCGGSPQPGYLNIDETSWQADQHARPWALPVETGAAEEVLVRHALSLHGRFDAARSFAEWARILRPAGSLRVVERDWDHWCREASECGTSEGQAMVWDGLMSPGTRSAWTYGMLKAACPSDRFTDPTVTREERGDLRLTANRREYPSLAAFILAGQERETLPGVIEHLRGHVDSVWVGLWRPDEETRLVAHELADHVIETTVECATYEEAHNELVPQVEADYVVRVECDERISDPALLRGLLADSPADCIVLARFDEIDGVRLSVTGSARDEQPRVARPTALNWIGPHLMPNVAGRASQVLRPWIWHIRSYDRMRASQDTWSKTAATLGVEHETRVNTVQDLASQRVGAILDRRRSGRKAHVLLTYYGMVGIGDHLMTLPAVRQVRALWPDANIAYHTKRPEALEGLDYIDEVITSELSWDDKQEYDAILGWETSLTGEPGKHVDGYDLSCDWIGVPRPESLRPDWIISRKHAKQADDIMASLRRKGKIWGLDLDDSADRIVGIVLTASCLHRTWPHIEEFSLRFLSEHPRHKILFLGGKGTDVLQLRLMKRRRVPLEDRMGWKDGKFTNVRDAAETVEDTEFVGHDRVIRTAGTMTMREEAALYPHLELLICPDTGPMHIAAALKIPTVAYFSVCPPELRISHFPNITGLMVDYPCAPCYVWGSVACDRTSEMGAQCMWTISTEDMMRAVNARLAAGTGEVRLAA